MDRGNRCHRSSKFAPPERELTLTGLELQEYKISMNDENFNDALCENTSHKIIKRWKDINWKTA